MKKSIILFLTSLMTLCASAQGGLSENQRLIGYTVTDDIDVNGAMVGQADTYTIGALLGPESLADYKGCKVVGIRMAAAVDLGRTRVFLDGISGSTMSTLQEKTQRVYEGWNEVFFNGDGYTITGDETLFYGFDYNETQAMLDNDKGGICGVGEDTTNAFIIYLENALNPVSKVGKLCVQLIVDVTNLPAVNMAFGFFDTGVKYKKADEALTVFTTLNNTGRDAITSYRIGARLDDGQPQYFDKTESIASGASSTWKQDIAVPENIAVGSHTLTTWVEAINSTTLGYNEAKAVVTKFAIYENTLPRNAVYVEIYNDQNSPYSDLLNPLMKFENDATVIPVNVHAPGTSLGVDEAADLHNFYAYTTPSFTINRAYFPGEAHIAYDMNDYLLAFNSSMLQAIISDMVTQDLTSPCFAGLTLTNSYDATSRKLTVQATGKVLPEAEAIFGKLALTLMAVEDNVTAIQQAVINGNEVTTNRRYKHDNVLRGYLTPYPGKILTIADGKFTASVEYTIPDAWDASNLKITGILTKADENGEAFTNAHAKEYDVINVASAKVIDGAGVADVDADAATAEVEGIYNLQGLRVADNYTPDQGNLTPGIYLRRYTDGRADKIAVR